jgi:UDP-2,4-diacetamido-2,4,6-trideoxy-beta-L-altropyranose hydrolase
VTNLVILTDGGGNIGFGHLMRCLAIKKAWEYGTVRLLAQMEKIDTTPKGVESIDWLNNIREVRQYALTDSILLVDSYRANLEHFRELKEIFPFVAALDDYNRISYPVDLVICPGVYGKEVDYSNQTALTVGGAEYVILRPEVLSARRPEVKKTIETVLVTFGGSQQNEFLFQKVINIVENAGYQGIVVTGNEMILSKLHAKNSHLYGKLDPVTMAKTMASVDLAVSAAGQTLNELAFLGVPFFAIKTGEDQHENWSYYKHNGLSMGSFLVDAENLESTLGEMLSKETAYSRLDKSRKLRCLLTTTGANVLCSLMKNMGGLSNE